VRLRRRQEDLDGGAQRLAGIGRGLADGRLHRRDEPVALADHVRLGHLLARAERVVERLAADARRERHLGHRYLRPWPGGRQLADRVQHAVTKELA
jgi:hypothetical protein